jgi:hypothetical protein
MQTSPREARAFLPRFLSSHPVLLLLFLTPGIPEYISSSSPLNAVILSPAQFIFQVAANLGLYGCGALLIHDARVRWGKGWASVLLMGAAYGILEEGVALSTLFNPKAGPVGSLGTYGHWLGVNWVWAAGIVPFHAIFSIVIPILLLGLALPETRARPLLTPRGTITAISLLSLDVVSLMLLIVYGSGYWMGWPILVLSMAAMGLLVLAARRASPQPFSRSSIPSGASNRNLALVGLSFFPAVILLQGLGQGAGLPAAVDFILVLLGQSLYLAYLVRSNRLHAPAAELALVIGLIVPIAILGVIAELALPFTLLADAALLLFFRGLWRAYNPKIDP